MNQPAYGGHGQRSEDVYKYFELTCLRQAGLTTSQLIFIKPKGIKLLYFLVQGFSQKISKSFAHKKGFKPQISC